MTENALPCRRKTGQLGDVLDVLPDTLPLAACPEPAEGASERSENASGRAGLTLKNRVGCFEECAPKNASGTELQVHGIASGCNGCSYEIVSGQTLWKVYGTHLNGRFGGLQGTGGLEETILDADGTSTGVINDQFVSVRPASSYS